MEVGVDLVWVSRQRMKKTLMANLLQMVDGLEVIDRGRISSIGQIKLTKLSNSAQSHSMQVFNPRREIKSNSCQISEDKNELIFKFQLKKKRFTDAKLIEKSSKCDWTEVVSLVEIEIDMKC